LLFGIDVETADENAKGFAQFGAELFHELQAPVTWYLTGQTLERYPEAFHVAAASGMVDLQAHTYAHLLLKSVLMRNPATHHVHGDTDWYFQPGGTLAAVDRDLGQCQQVFRAMLGHGALALCGPWGHYRGLGDRPDLLEVVYKHGFRCLRSFARNEWDAQPVPLEWQPYCYELQGYPDLLEVMTHGYQDDFYWEAFTRPRGGERYINHLRSVAERVAADDLTWSLCSHDHNCATLEGFEEKGQWYREILAYARDLGMRFVTASTYYQERLLVGAAQR
jgi:peptidoglycan/xylan/chitin deacetylase (PgdA/CDA1 family)